MIGFNSLSRMGLSRTIRSSNGPIRLPNKAQSFPRSNNFSNNANPLVRYRATATAAVKRISNSIRPPLTRTARRYLSNPASTPPKQGTFLQRWMAHKTIPERWSLPWVGEMALIFTVFGVTGSSTMFLVRPVISSMIQMEGTMKDGKLELEIPDDDDDDDGKRSLMSQ